MSRSPSTGGPTSSLLGFSVYQPTLGAPLQFLPAVGTKELEQLIDAYLPGPASAPEKRASISMDFFEHSGQTGEDFKYYAVYTPVATPESAKSTPFNVSPVMSDLSFYGSSSQASTPAAAPAVKKARVASRKSAPKQERNDFAHLPGMKILTKDGEDVTNSVSRGCKSKEQRDHAHLMRILKACDACKKKKIRCDPSHKKRTASQVESESKSEVAKPAKKTKKDTAAPACTVSNPKHADNPFQMDDVGLNADLSAPLGDSWEQFLTFNDEVVAAAPPQESYGAISPDFDFFFGLENNNFSPSASGSSGSPPEPFTPISSSIALQTGNHNSLAFLQSEDNSQDLALPYLDPAGPHGSNYMDFNLFSPASSFLDEEPQLLKSGRERRLSSSRTHNANAPLASTGLLDDQEWHFDQSRFTVNSSIPEPRVPGDRNPSARQLTTGDGEIGYYGGSHPYHANNAGHSSVKSVNVLTKLQSTQATSRNTSAATMGSPGEHILGGTGLSSSSAATGLASLLTRSASPQVIRQVTILQQGTGNAHVIPQTVSLAVRSFCALASFKTSMLTPAKELQVLESGRRRSGRSTTNNVQPLSAASEAVGSHSGSRSLSRQSPSSDGLHGTNSPLQDSLARGQEARIQSPVAGLRILTEGLNSSLKNVNVALPVHDYRDGGLSGLLRPAANTPMRLLESNLAGGALLPTPPVRQLLSGPLDLTQLVAFGLVSLLLMVVVLSTLPTQTQTNINILTNLPITSVVLVSLLSNVSAHQRPRAMSAGGAIDSLRSTISSAASTWRRSRPAGAGAVARVPLLSCI
ncbi:hypothetical protein VPNG_07325 [Cytospora leucostoma]|uniref:Uncharacterized protein n=1 Tax=Cytospora leucostoma TaxID=1230097 RepID=A0A423WV78_9PEZI|nr:hypothetical protein VPNG_07325 [Cytospora leucostoma]